MKPVHKMTMEDLEVWLLEVEEVKPEAAKAVRQWCKFYCLFDAATDLQQMVLNLQDVLQKTDEALVEVMAAREKTAMQLAALATIFAEI